MDEQKKQKTKKILNIVVNVVVAVILLLALLVTINNISSKQKGYTSLFGTAFVVVQTDSMDPNGHYAQEKNVDYEAEGKLPGFAPGDLLSVKILSDEEKRNLEEGDIISFFIFREDDNGERTRDLDSHRIYSKVVNEETGVITYHTRGDNAPQGSYEVITTDTLETEQFYLVGKVTGNAGAIGHVLNFFNSSTGFLVCIVIPSFLIVIFFAFNLAREIIKAKKAGAAENKAKYEEELLAKLRAQGVQIPADIDASATTEQTAESEPAEGEKKE